MLNKKLINIALAGFISFNLLAPRASAKAEANVGTNAGVRRAVEAQVKNFLNARGNILRGTVTAVGTTDITVDNEGTSVKVNLTTKTQFRRLFWGKSSLAEITVGDKLNIIGRWANEEKTEINAVLIKNLSLMRRLGAFFGEVESLTAEGFVVTTIHNDDQTVTIGAAKLVNREEQTITQADIKVGDRIRVKGLWDATAKTITEVTQIKDFSLPAE
jgi:co-chaperonin GroES (HSP10)